MRKKIPITVGVVGHRDAVITAKHMELITGLFDDLNKKYPHSPVCLFSQLAIGADTVVAGLFLDIKRKTKRDYELIVPLPFETELYRSKFDPADRLIFDGLIAQAARTFVVNTDPEKSHTEDELYRNGGRFVADSAIILLAIWDEKHNNAIGGTADVVRYKIEGAFDENAAESLYDLKGLLLTLNCSRSTNENRNHTNLPDTPLIHGLKKHSTYKRSKQLNEKEKIEREYNISKEISLNKALDKVEELNAGVDMIDAEEFSRSERYLFAESAELSHTNKLIRRYHAITDAQAIYHQSRYNKIIAILFLLGPVVLYFFEWYKEADYSKVILLLTCLWIAFACSIFCYSRQKQNHLKFLENRVLAEALRIQFFWDLGNVQEKVSSYILRIHSTEFNWIKHILLAVHGATFNTAINNTSPDVIKTHWLKDQEQYFFTRLKRTGKILNRYNTASKVVVCISFALLASLFLLDYPGQRHLLNIVATSVGVLSGILALSKAYIDKKGFEQTTNQYTLMHGIYHKTLLKIDQVEASDLSDERKEEALLKLYFLAGKEALIENGNWYLIFKKKEPEVQGMG